MREEDEFSIRPRAPRRLKDDQPKRVSSAFRRIVHYARQTSGVGRSSARSNHRQHLQRCAVRITYSSNRVRGTWRAHGRYVKRDSARGSHPDAGKAFNEQSQDLDMAGTLHQWQTAGDPRLFKIILSAEFGERLDLTVLTRDFMRQLQRDLATTLEWTAINHYNTEHPHTHIAVRGVARGQELRLPRELIKQRARQFAQQSCTNQLGFRTQRDAKEAALREVDAVRVTSHDRQLLQHAKATPEGLSVRLKDITQHPATAVLLQRRLQALQRMKLAQPVRGTWQLRRDFQEVLKAMALASDRQRALAQHQTALSDPRMPLQVADLKTPQHMQGRIIAHGEEEGSGRRYALLEGCNGIVYFLCHHLELERARAAGGVKINAFVEISVRPEHKPAMEVLDYGDANALLKQESVLKQIAAGNSQRGDSPTVHGYSGWLGQYQTKMASIARAPQRTRGRGR